MPNTEIFRNSRWEKWPGTGHKTNSVDSEGFRAAEKVLKGGSQDGVFVREVADEFGEVCTTHTQPKFADTELVSGPPAVDD
jgi:hypothetical protein